MSLSMKLAKETSKFIGENKGSPLLAFLSLYAVHGPLQTTQQKWKKYRNKAESAGIAETGLEMERRLPIRKQQDNPVYGGLIEQMDEAVGHVLETLKAQGLDDNTVVIFTSDNGGVASGDNYSSNMLDLRGGKGYQWEGGIKVPFIFYTPWLTVKGTVNETPVIGTDLYPTLLDLAGLPPRPQEHQDGLSLVSALDGKALSERPLYWHYPHYGNQGGDPSSVIRIGDWKLIHYWEDDTDELYQLKEDSSEQNDLAQQHPETTLQLRTQLLEWLDSVGANKAVHDPEYSEARFKQKEAWFRDTLMPRLEKGRKKMLEPDWQPNADWWGSKTD